jgi:alginate O-acetyltransferase complex protein AlgI
VLFPVPYSLFPDSVVTFNSFVFVLFLAAVLIVHSVPLPWTIRKFNLLVASYLFYAAWDVSYVALLVLSTILNGGTAAVMGRYDDRTTLRKALLWIATLLNLGVLAAFKYGNDLLGLAHSVSHRLGIPYSPPKITVLLPIGLSFFTFQAMSYTIDVYRRTIKPAGSVLDLALFISFFPVLLAGPILRAGQFLPQCTSPRRATGSEFGWGMALFTLGLFMKVTLADYLLSPVTRQVFDPYVTPDALSVWTGTLAFAGQDYCDFAGYSTCAMGIALCLGFVVPENFRAPLASIGFRDLWQRWHITLVAWMRDYVFNPLGGVHKGFLHAAINVMIVMLLIGLWHGAAWTYLIFGFLHGTYLIGETILQRSRLRGLRIWTQPIGKLLLWAMTIVLCLIAFVFYCATSMEHAWRLLSMMFGISRSALPFRLSDWDLLVAVVVCELLGVAHCLRRNASLDVAVTRVPWWTVSIGLALMLVAIILSSADTQNDFLYFQY